MPPNKPRVFSSCPFSRGRKQTPNKKKNRHRRNTPTPLETLEKKRHTHTNTYTRTHARTNTSKEMLTLYKLLVVHNTTWLCWSSFTAWVGFPRKHFGDLDLIFVPFATSTPPPSLKRSNENSHCHPHPKTSPTPPCCYFFLAPIVQIFKKLNFKTYTIISWGFGWTYHPPSLNFYLFNFCPKIPAARMTLIVNKRRKWHISVWSSIEKRTSK